MTDPVTNAANAVQNAAQGVANKAAAVGAAANAVKADVVVPAESWLEANGKYLAIGFGALVFVLAVAHFVL